MKTSSCFCSPISFCLCVAAAAFFASDLKAQNAVKSSPMTMQGTAVLQSEANAPGDTNAVRESVAALQARVARAVPRALANVESTNGVAKTSEDQAVIEASQVRAVTLMEKAQTAMEPPGGVLESLVVNNHLLNVDFGDYTKTGFAAIGQTANDYWNPYVMPYYSLGTLQNILWSDQSASPVDVTVDNAPGQWGNGLCVDPMYTSFIYPWDSGHITVTIADLPANTYDFYVYATRASDFSPVAQFQRAGVTLWTKGTTQWGEGWYSQYWDEGEQYVRFRNIEVNSQTITVDMQPDAAGCAAISGLQIVPSSAIPSEQPVITKLMNVDFGGTGSPYKVGFGAVGLTASDFWNGDYHPGSGAVTVANLKWSDQTVGPVAMTVLNGPGCWGNSLPDAMFRSYMYSWDGGNIRITLNDLPAGICDVYLYGHTPTADDNAVFELWSDDVNWGTKGTSLIGDGPTYATWEVGQQYVLFKDVTVTAGKPLIIHAKHTTYGYNNVSGMQIAYTGAADTDADGLPDGWERRCFNDLDQIANADTDGDGLTNLREYQLGTDPARTDSNGNGIADLYDFEKVWVEDGTPQGGYETGDNEWWNWVSYWYDGDGWGGQEVYPHSGRWWDPLMHVSDNVPGNLHQHYFSSSAATMRPGVGDVLYAYINLDSSYPPSEVMLQWYVVGEDGYGSWEHRAYWGADLIDAGQNGTQSRYPMGALPTAGQWVRLEVPASAVGLEGKIVEGMAYTLHGGRAAWDSAGTMNPDRDGDSLLDAWEIQYFGNLLQTATGDNDGDGLSNLGEYQHGTNPTNPDTDGDALWDSEELEILLDASNPSLGYLDPLDADTGNTGKPDGQKDGDQDGITNLGEIRDYLSDPSAARTFYPFIKVDSEYFHSAKGGEGGLTMADLTIVDLGGGLRGFGISGAFAGAVYDLYFVNNIAAQRWQWRRVLSGIQCDDAGEAMFQLQQPDPYQGYFIILSAEDQDGDGLSDGYESWFTYNGQRTKVDDPFSDTEDQMKDGWEVEYGLNPTIGTGAEGGGVDRDSDGLSNQTEHNNYYAATAGYDATFDPLIANPAQRPVITIVPADPPVMGFTIKRDVPDGVAKPALPVHYAVGGSAEYLTDYTLTPSPTGLPRIYTVQIPLDADSVTVTISPTAAGLQKGRLSVVTTLTPYAVSPETQQPNPLAWAYAVDWNHNRVTNYFTGTPAEGILINLNKEGGTGYLRINSTAATTPLPFVNLASSGRGTVARIEVPNPWNPSLTASRVAGEYYTTPFSGQANAGNPSRTTVDRYGNVWVGNRDVGGDAGSVTKIGVVIGGTRGKKIGQVFVPDPQPLPQGQSPGEYLQPPFVYNTCVDRDRDGLIHTSYGLDSRLAWNDPALPAGDGDEAIIYYVPTTPTGVRSVAVDRDNNLWVGSRDNGWQELIDDRTGAPKTGMKFSYGSGGYGGVFDPYGVLWSAGYGYNGLLRLPPGIAANVLPATAGGILPGTQYGYGIGIDPTTANIWLGDYNSGGLWQFKQSGCSVKIGFAPAGNPSGNDIKGIVVDGSGDVWVAHAKLSPDPGQSVYRLRNTGEYRGAVVLSHPTLPGVVGKSPHGVCIDSQQRVWAICFEPAEDGKYYAMRIDPTQGVDPNTGNVVGQVVEAVDLGTFNAGEGPYNYSDMSGFVSLGATQPAGVWDFVEDSGSDYTVWSSVTLDTVLNSGDIIVEVRAADRITDLPAWQFRRLNGTSGTIAFGSPALKGRYLEVRVNLLRAFGAAQSPVLRKLTLAWGSPGAALQITGQPKSQIADRGGSAVLNVTAIGTGLSYQWFRNEVAVGTSSTLTINNAQYINAGEYYVRVTGAAGGVLNSAKARLHVNSTPGSTPSVVLDNPFPVLGQAVNLDAAMNISPSPGPVYYQWRWNGVPIPNAYGPCATSDNQNYTAAYSIAAVQCADTGEYSVVFTNEYWKAASPGVQVTVMDATFNPVPQVTVTATGVPITDRHNPPTLTATACFTPVCAQWYRTDSSGGRYFKELIPGATGMQYTFPNPVPCAMLTPWDYFMVEVFDEGRVPHTSIPVRVYGDCQP